MTYNQAEKRQIEQALEDILSSSGFANSNQLSNFLRFIVTKTINNETDKIKGYTIGVDALGRPHDFDPQTDPSVRVMAGRLRQALENYNRDIGGFKVDNKLIQLELIKGNYIPKINIRDATNSPASSFTDRLAALEETEIDSIFDNNNTAKPPTPSAERQYPWQAITALVFLLIGSFASYHYYSEHVEIKPTVLPPKQVISLEDATLPSIILNVNSNSGDLPDWISYKKVHSTAVVAFSRFNEYRIFDFKDKEDRFFLDQFQSDYYLSILLSKRIDNDNLEVFITLSRPPDSEVIWSDKLTFPPTAGQQAEKNFSKVTTITSEIMSPYGIIHGDITANKYPPPRLNCIRAVYSYFAKEDLQAYANGLDCARRITARPNASSSIYAMLTFLYVEAYRKQIIEVSDTPLKDAAEYAKKAIQLDPGNARAFQALFSVEKTSGHQEKAIKAAQKAVSLNPYDRDIIGDYAAYLISINRQEEAKPILEKALELTPTPPAWLNFYAYLHEDITGNLNKADELAARFSPDDSPLLAIAVILSAHRQNDHHKVKKAYESLARQEPDVLVNPVAAFIRRGFSEELAKDIAARFQAASLQRDYTLNTQ